MSFARMLEGLGIGDDDSNTGVDKVSTAEQIEKLKTAAAAYLTKNEFKPGDIIVAKKDCPAPIKSADEPHIVIDVDVAGVASTDEYSAGEGVPRTLRAACFARGHFVTFLLDPQYFEPYVG